MGIKTEYNPDLALRNISESKTGKRKINECIPEKLKIGQIHAFLKKGQRNYWMQGEIPLVETKGDENPSKPLASVIILEATHFILDGETYTKGKYKIAEVFSLSDPKVHFNGFSRIK